MTVILPPLSVNFNELLKKLRRICWYLLSSPSIDWIRSRLHFESMSAIRLIPLCYALLWMMWKEFSIFCTKLKYSLLIVNLLFSSFARSSISFIRFSFIADEKIYNWIISSAFPTVLEISDWRELWNSLNVWIFSISRSCTFFAYRMYEEF